MKENIKYPIGEQDFRSLREGGFVYVDKTRFIYDLVSGSGKYFFLARPRRFGKSLFLSTLQYFFEGRRELFKGLYVDSSDWDWQTFPVLHLDLNFDRYAGPGHLEGVLNKLFRGWEEKYGVDVKDYDYPQRFKTIIEKAHQFTGLPVVILVDEYDKPLVGNINKWAEFEHYRTKLSSLYSNLKSAAEHIRFVMLTGVSRFSKLSVFSDLNNLRDISFDDAYSDICGITPEELSEYFHSGIEDMGRKNGVDYPEACRWLKDNYDGYKFAAEGREIYNPWSLLNCLTTGAVENYWNETGMPTIVAESLKRVNADLEDVFDTYCSQDDLKGLDLLNPKPLALMYQTGYLTIKSYNRKVRRYHIGIPNREVKTGLLNVLLPYYVKVKKGTVKEVFNAIAVGFILGRPDEAMKAMQAYFAGIDYKMRIENENNFHNAFYLLADLLGLETSTEVHTSEGSIDMVIKTEDYVYIIELKYNHTAREALAQIEDRHYARPYQSDHRKVIKIGVAFSSVTRCIEDWVIESRN